MNREVAGEGVTEDVMDEEDSQKKEADVERMEWRQKE